MPFDAAVGVPVAFYTVAYAYALFDANKRLGDILTTGALTFGLWYSEFVLVAVVSVVRQPLFLLLKSMTDGKRLTQMRVIVSTQLHQHDHHRECYL